MPPDHLQDLRDAGRVRPRRLVEPGVRELLVLAVFGAALGACLWAVR